MRVYVEAFGCAQNLGEAATLERTVEAAGHRLVRDPAHAEAGILVTCGVIGPTEARMVRRFEALRERLPRVVVTGCLVPLRTSLFSAADSTSGGTAFVPIRDQALLPNLLQEWSDGAPVQPAPAAPAEVERTVVEEVNLAQGCTSHCTYCFSRLARGPLRSVPSLDVLARVAEARDRGAAEIRLSSLDTSCWGSDQPNSGGLPTLLEQVRTLPGEFRVRVGMMSPQSLAPIATRLWDALDAPRFFRFLHLPVQSGSDPVLAAMRRGYSVATFRTLVREARERIPDLTLATDVIIGFPGETDADFEASLGLVEEVAPEILNVTRFSPRPMTPAARLTPVRSAVVKGRSRAMTALRMRVARARMERWIGWEGGALVVERGRGGTSVARLPNYLPLVLPASHRLGSRVPVRVDGARSTYLLGRAVPAADGSPGATATVPA